MPKSQAFKEIYNNISKAYLGEKVPSKYQGSYGKRYDKKDIKSFAIAVAKSRGIKFD